MHTLAPRRVSFLTGYLVVTNEREINRLLEIVTIDVTNVSHKPGIYIHTHTKQCKSTVYSRKVTKLLFAI